MGISLCGDVRIIQGYYRLDVGSGLGLSKWIFGTRAEKRMEKEMKSGAMYGLLRI